MHEDAFWKAADAGNWDWESGGDDENVVLPGLQGHTVKLKNLCLAQRSHQSLQGC